jgi:hypothetical protein
MKKCEICGTPIIAHKNLSLPIFITYSYKCPSCGNEYRFKDNLLHYALLFGLYLIVFFIIYYSLKFELTRYLVTMTIGYLFCFFIHHYFRTKMVFTKSILKSKEIVPEEKLIDQIRKWE